MYSTSETKERENCPPSHSIYKWIMDRICVPRIYRVDLLFQSYIYYI